MSSQVLTNQESHAIAVWVRLLRGHAALRRTLDAQLHGEHRLTVNDYEALLLLSRADGRHMRRVDLAEGLQLTDYGVTRLLDEPGPRQPVEQARHTGGRELQSLGEVDAPARRAGGARARREGNLFERRTRDL